MAVEQEFIEYMKHLGITSRGAVATMEQWGKRMSILDTGSIWQIGINSEPVEIRMYVISDVWCGDIMFPNEPAMKEVTPYKVGHPTYQVLAYLIEAAGGK